jgi:hypothetical protein
MLDLARHIMDQKSARFDIEKFEGHYETALVNLINSKHAGKALAPKARRRGDNVVELMKPLRQSVGAFRPHAPQIVKGGPQGFGWAKRDADAHRGQKGEGKGEEVIAQSAAQVRLARVRRTLRTGVADRVQDTVDRRGRLILRKAGRRLLVGQLDSSLPGMRIGPILHPAMFLALADVTGLQQD